MQVLLDAGADPDAPDPEGNAPLHLVIDHPKLFIDNPEPVKKMVKMLLEHGADTEVRDANNYTPLHLAAGGVAPESRDNPQVVELLLDHGADPHAEGYQGRTPCERAESVVNQRSRRGFPPNPASQRLIELACSP